MPQAAAAKPCASLSFSALVIAPSHPQLLHLHTSCLAFRLAVLFSSDRSLFFRWYSSCLDFTLRYCSAFLLSRTGILHCSWRFSPCSAPRQPPGDLSWPTLRAPAACDYSCFWHLASPCLSRVSLHKETALRPTSIHYSSLASTIDRAAVRRVSTANSTPSSAPNSQNAIRIPENVYALRASLGKTARNQYAEHFQIPSDRPGKANPVPVRMAGKESTATSVRQTKSAMR